MNHIKSVTEDTIAFCGVKGEAFKTVEQAIFNGMHNSGLHMCHECTLMIINILSKPIEGTVNENT